MTILEKFSRLLLEIKQIEREDSPAKTQGLSPTHIRILGFLHDDEEAGTTRKSAITALATAMGISSPSVSVAVSQLEEKQLIEKRKNTNGDSRIVLLITSNKGKKLYREILKFRENRAKEILKVLDENEQETLLKLLEKILTPMSDVKSD